MRITEVNIPADEAMGLQAIKMSRLGKVVLLAGANGAGKTRILQRVKGAAGGRLTEDEVKNIKVHIDNCSFNIKNDSISEEGVQKISNMSFWNGQVEESKRKIEVHELIETDEDKKPILVDFVPKNLSLEDCNNFNKNQLVHNSSAISHNLGVASTSVSTLAKIQTVQDIWRESTHQVQTITSESKEKNIQDYEKLKSFINAFLCVELGRDEKGNATLFGLPIGTAKLSDGQSVLLQLCVAIYSQADQLEDVIVFMDEPENHLHPKALIDTVTKISEVLTNGQLWIATHSIHLLAHFESSAIHYVEKGKVSYAGNTPEIVLAGLLGGQDEQQKIQDFLHLPAQMAVNQYALECLRPPVSLDGREDDPQAEQIFNVIKEKHKEGEPLRILDYGAGKGRLLLAIDELSKQKALETPTWIDYFAYDLPDDRDSIDKCKAIIQDIYGLEAQRHFTKAADLRSGTNPNSFDVVIMCNVLHEIEKDTWKSEIGPDSTVVSRLKEDGHLLVVEDSLLPIGEKAHKHGFLVFEKGEFQKLCNANPEKQAIKQDISSRNGRLQAHLIPRRLLENITDVTIVTALTELQRKSKEEIQKIRKQEASSKNGKLLAFWTQQFANATLALG